MNTEPPRRLSPREREIAKLISQGLSNAAIAARLFLSVRTVEGHIYRGSIKCDATNRYEFARATWTDHLPTHEVVFSHPEAATG
jgi:DNA-binding NarL/FixJ family response regulator